MFSKNIYICSFVLVCDFHEMKGLLFFFLPGVRRRPHTAADL